jgi:hypothetical protein
MDVILAGWVFDRSKNRKKLDNGCRRQNLDAPRTSIDRAVANRPD